MIEVSPDPKFYSASDLVPKWKLVLGQIIDLMDGRTRAISQAAESAFHVGFPDNQLMLVKHGENALLHHVSLAEGYLRIDKHFKVITQVINTIKTPCLLYEKGKPEITEILFWGNTPKSADLTAEQTDRANDERRTVRQNVNRREPALLPTDP